MKGLTKWIIIAVSLIFCIQAVSAFAVSSISVDPSGSLTPGTPVIVSFKVDLSAAGDETFTSGNELQMSTDLDSAKWTYSLVLDGVDMPNNPRTRDACSPYPAGFSRILPDVEESLKVTLEGTAPSVSQTTNKTMIKIAGSRQP